jgi:hypothetical protein
VLEAVSTVLLAVTAIWGLVLGGGWIAAGHPVRGVVLLAVYIAPPLAFGVPLLLLGRRLRRLPG